MLIFRLMQKKDPLGGRMHSSSSNSINNGRKIKAIYHIGQAVNMAVEKFMTIAETIADDNPEIKTDMHEACKDARDAGKYNLGILKNSRKCQLMEFVFRSFRQIN